MGAVPFIDDFNGDSCAVYAWNARKDPALMFLLTKPSKLPDERLSASIQKQDATLMSLY